MRLIKLFIFCGLACLCWQSPKTAQHASKGFADPVSCASCHQTIAESYARTAMARTFGVVALAQQLPELKDGNFHHTASAQQFTVITQGNQPHLKRHQTGFDGSVSNDVSARMDYWFGSGKHARSYISRTQNNELIELPLTWYAEGKGYWAMSPGYDRADHAGFSRKLTYRCMSCHNGFIELPNPTWETGTRFPAQLPAGIDCQRCHGPGQAHVVAAQNGFSLEQIRQTIVNPARLTPERQIEVCLQCHLETTTLRLPASLLRAGREVFSYRPGEPLADYILHFDRAAKSAERFEFASAAYRLRQSACFKTSGGHANKRLTCTTCHNPHEPSDTPAAQQRYLTACLNCHQPTLPKLIAAGKHTSEQNCAACHLPKRHPADAIHTLVTDHFIQRKPAPETSGERIEHHDGNTPPYRGVVEFYYPSKLANTADDELYGALAQVKHDANLALGLSALAAALARHQPAQAEFYFELAEAYRRADQLAESLPFYEQATTRAKNDWRVWLRYGTALVAANQPQRAAIALERAQTLAPQESAPLEAIAHLLAQQNRSREAVAALRAALALEPAAAPLHAALGARLVQLNDTKAAEQAWREAVRLRPESAAHALNLANLLARHGDFAEARHYFQAALRSAPGFADAHLAYAIALAERGESAPAEKGLTATLALAPQHHEAHLRLGQLLLARGATAQAAPHLRKAAESKDARIREAANRLLSTQ